MLESLRRAGVSSKVRVSGMVATSGLLAAVLAALSVSMLSLLSFLCLRCKRKSKIIQENYIYDPQMFQHGRNVFVVTQSTTVTRVNTLTSPPIEVCGDASPAAIEDQMESDEQADYENIKDGHMRSLEHTYVAPLPITFYENEQNEIQTGDVDQAPHIYANMLSSINDDDDDYENSQFLSTVVKEQETYAAAVDPDYENQNGDWTG
ncbi:LAT2 domain-containing protein isoform X3 [Antennarius striatus]|uniref:LAT2 domain-containing protein isoform X3 n=1 Tax=Antennarius striatus TaxID=241820 RepID=UPI0035B1D9F6